MNEKVNISTSAMIGNEPLNMKQYVIPTFMNLLDLPGITMHDSSMIKIDEEKEKKSISKKSHSTYCGAWYRSSVAYSL